MKTLKTLKELPQLFRYADLQKFTGNANVFLTRARNNGLVTRIAKGVYVNSFLKGFPLSRRWPAFCGRLLISRVSGP